MSRLFLTLVVVLVSILSLAAAQSYSVSFSQVASTSAFPGREYAACTQTTANTGSTPTLYFYGGFNVTLNATASTSTSNSYYDTYFNDAWSSTNNGQSWNLLTGAAQFPAQAWGGAVYTQSGSIVFIGAGGDSNAGENNQVFFSTDGVTFTAASSNGPWQPRENAGIAGMRGTNNILVALGNTGNSESVDDIWLSTDGGKNWNQTCHYTSCPFVSSVNPNQIAGQVHGPAAAGLSTGYWLLIGGYGNDPASTSTTTWVTNQVAISNNGFVTWSTYSAPWTPRAQQRAVVDADNYVFVYGGVYDLPVTGSGSYSSVPSQAYYGYFTEVWYSTNSTSASPVWIQLSVSGLGSAGYPNLPFPNNPNSGVIPSSFYTNGANFNPCLALSYSSSGTKQLILYTGLYAGYRQNNQSLLQVQYPGVYVGTLNIPGSGNGAAAFGASVVSVVVAAMVAIVAHML